MAYPRIITLARARLTSLVNSPKIRYGRSRGIKAMKKDYAEKLITLFDCMLQVCALQFEGKFCVVKDGVARPMTIPEMAKFSNYGQRCVERLLHDAKNIGMVQSERQFIRMFPEGLKVSAVLRMFTKLFWQSLGLWSLFVESVKYASQNGKLKFKNPIKTVGDKKPPDQLKEERRRSRQNNQLFLFAVQCEHLKDGKACPGRYKGAEICDTCHKILG